MNEPKEYNYITLFLIQFPLPICLELLTCTIFICLCQPPQCPDVTIMSLLIYCHIQCNDLLSGLVFCGMHLVATVSFASLSMICAISIIVLLAFFCHHSIQHRQESRKHQFHTLPLEACTETHFSKYSVYIIHLLCFLFSSLLSHPRHFPLNTCKTPFTTLPRFPSPLEHLAVLVPPLFSHSQHS